MRTVARIRNRSRITHRQVATASCQSLSPSTLDCADRNQDVTIQYQVNNTTIHVYTVDVQYVLVAPGGSRHILGNGVHHISPNSSVNPSTTVTVSSPKQAAGWDCGESVDIQVEVTETQRGL